MLPRARNLADNNDIIGRTTIKDLLRMIFGRFSHSWFFRSTSEVLGVEQSNVTSAKRLTWVCNQRVLSRAHCQEKEQEPPLPLSRVTHTRLPWRFANYSRVSPNRAMRWFARSEGIKILISAGFARAKPVQFGMFLRDSVNIEHGK